MSEGQSLPASGRSNFRRQLDRWALGLTEATVQGGATAVKAFFGVAGAHAVLPQVPQINLHQAVAVLAFGAAWHFFDYLASHRLSDSLREAPAVRPPGEATDQQQQQINQ